MLTNTYDLRRRQNAKRQTNTPYFRYFLSQFFFFCFEKGGFCLLKDRTSKMRSGDDGLSVSLFDRRMDGSMSPLKQNTFPFQLIMFNSILVVVTLKCFFLCLLFTWFWIHRTKYVVFLVVGRLMMSRRCQSPPSSSEAGEDQ